MKKTLCLLIMLITINAISAFDLHPIYDNETGECEDLSQIRLDDYHCIGFPPICWMGFQTATLYTSSNIQLLAGVNQTKILYTNVQQYNWDVNCTGGSQATIAVLLSKPIYFVAPSFPASEDYLWR